MAGEENVVRLTDDQIGWRAWLRTQVRGVNERARVVVDSEGWAMVPGRLGQVEVTTDEGWLAVYTTRMRVVPRLLAVKGMRRRQVGGEEVRLWFPAGDPEALRQVFQVIRPRVRRASDTAKHLTRPVPAA